MKTSLKIVVFIFLALSCCGVYASTSIWQGYAGDFWNTASSPYALSETNPLSTLWSVTTNAGQFNRASGVCLVDAGSTATPYVFGSDGWNNNRPYRRSRTDGAVTTWTAANGTNDSGSDFRVATSPDGKLVVHMDIYNTNPPTNVNIRAYRTDVNPAGVPVWSTFILGVSSNGIKFGPDGRLYGRGTIDGVSKIFALDPNSGAVVWLATTTGLNNTRPGAFWDTGSTIQYVVSDNSTKIKAFDINAASTADVLWSYVDAQSGFAAPTIDPDTGNIYVFRQTRPIALTWSGQLVWTGATAGAGEGSQQHGALSRDGSTFYCMTGNATYTGNLYAYDTTNGSIKWCLPIYGRANAVWGGPVVSNNGVIIVPNGNGTPLVADPTKRNAIYAVKDNGTSATILGKYDLWATNDVGGPHIAIGPGTIYWDGWALDNSVKCFAMRGSNLPVMVETTSLPDGKVNTAYSRTLSAIGGTAPYSWSATGLPSGFSINPTTGEISGTNSTGGNFSVIVTVTDSSGSLASFNITLPLYLAGSDILPWLPPPTARVGVPFSEEITTDVDLSPYAWSLIAGSYPPGITDDASTTNILTLSGTPTQTGTFDFTMQSTDNIPWTDTQPFQLVVDPMDIGGTLPGGRVGVAYSGAPTLLGGFSPFTFVLDSGALPPGLNLDAGTGAISGTPTTAGTYQFTLSVADSGTPMNTDSASFSIEILSMELSGTFLAAWQNFYYQDSIELLGGVAPFNFTISAGSLPPGLVINSTSGLVSGTPTTLGQYSFNIKVTDSGANEAEKEFAIEVKYFPLDIITLSIHNGQVGVAYQSSTFKYAASSTTAKTWSQPAGTVPPGLSLAPAGIDYVLSGTPTTAGSYLFSILVTDGMETQINNYYVLIDTNPSAFGNWKRVANDPTTWPYPLDPANVYTLAATGELYPSSPTSPNDNRPHPTMHNAVTNANGKVIVGGGYAAQYNIAGPPALTINTNGGDPKFWDNRQSKFSIYNPATDTWDSAYWHDWTALGSTNGYVANGQPTGYNNAGSGGVGGTAKPTVGFGTYAGVNSCCAIDADSDGTEEYFIFCGYPIWSEVAGIYDPDTNSWSATPPITGFAGQVSHSMAVVKDGKIYLIAQYTTGTPAVKYWAFRIYDTATSTWTVKPDIPLAYQKELGAAEIIGNEIIVTGGNNASTVIYDIPSDTWSTDAAWDIPAGYGTRLAGSGVFNGKMYIMGGLSNTDGSYFGYRSMAYFDPATRTWTTMTDQLPYGMNGSGAAIVGDTLYACYGRRMDWSGAAYISTVTNETFALKLAAGAVKPVITNVARTASLTITWQSVAGATYRVESSTSPYDPAYNESLMTWTNEVTGLASGGTSTSWTDVAAVGEKYYRVYTEDAGGDLVADDTVGQMTILAKTGRNLMSSMFEPYPAGGGAPGASTLDKIVGNQLTGHSLNKFLSDNIELWVNASGAYKRAWYKTGTTNAWQDWDIAGPPAFGMDADKGYWFNIISGHVQKNVMFCGRVSKASRSIPIAIGRNLVGSCFPVSCTLAKSGLVASGFTGHNLNKFLSDNVEFWKNPGAIYERFWYKTGTTNAWQPWNVGDPMRNIAAGDSIWVNVLNTHAAFTWTYPVPPRP